VRPLAWLTILLVWFSPLRADDAGTPRPVRAIFDEAVYWAGTPEQVEHVLDRVAAAGFNTYIPCVWHGQGAIWPSAVAQHWYRNRELAARDPLRDFIRAAHARGIRVMPCFTLVLRQHDFYPQFVAGSGRHGVFDVHDRGFREFAAELVAEVVERYPVDGINLDYVRAGQVCYDADCRAGYTEATGRNLLLDLGRIKLDDSAARAAVVGWQRGAVEALVETVARRARRLRPDILISVDAAPWAESVVIEGQDSLAWADSGLVDLVFSMNYQPEPPWEQLRDLRDDMARPARLAVMVSSYVRRGDASELVPRSGPEMVGLVRRAAEFNPDGAYAVYLYSLLSDEQIAWLGGSP